MDSLKICEGLSDISDGYQGFLIDQWGTLHDGQTLFPDVLEALQNLRKRGKQVILISNSGKRAAADQKRLGKMGLKNDLFDHIVTSTETAWQSLNDREDGLFRHLGERYFLLNRDGDTDITEGLKNLVRVDDIDHADFVLLTGSDAPDKTLENYYDAVLKAAARRQLKMICANPEKIMTINAQHFLGSGDIARRYEEFGGVVNYIGKPFPAMFQYAISLFDGLYPSQICVIGDSLAHDIRGARYLDIDCALVASGVHHGAFTKVKSTADIQKILAVLGKNYGTMPNYFIPRFHWGRALPDRKNRKKGDRG